MKITITQAIPSPSGLRLALRVEHEKAGWIRFSTAVLLVEKLDLESRQYITQCLNTYMDEFLDAGQLELF